jgi:hypothetical protein
VTEIVEITHDLGQNLGQWELFQPKWSGKAPMRSGTCSDCGGSTKDYKGACASIRYRNAQGEVEYRSGVTSNYGHFECVRDMFVKLMTDEIATRHVPNTPADLTVHVGRQRDLIDFKHAHPGQIVESVYYRDAPRNAHYHFALKGVMK